MNRPQSAPNATATPHAVTGAGDAVSAADADGVILQSAHLRARVVDNRTRPKILDDLTVQASGLASLVHASARKNLFSACGLNLQGCKPTPESGPCAGKPVGARDVPVQVTRTGSHSARVVMRGNDHKGLGVTLDYQLGDQHIDQTITASPDHDLTGFDLFFASYMNGPSNTSIFLQGQLQGDPQPRWYEVASAGHGGPDGGDRNYYRPFDPAGKSWDQHLVDNPLLRQRVTADEATIQATRAAGFRTNTPNKCAFTGFYYALFDDHLFLMIFREPQFYFWVSCSGGQALRNPAWDYGIREQALSRGQQRSYHCRLVVKPFAGVADVLQEVAAFRAGATGLCGGFPS